MAIIAMTGPGGVMTGPGRNDDHFRHCEARSAVAIHAVVRPPMDCFVPLHEPAVLSSSWNCSDL